jgi:hypothetical protein
MRRLALLALVAACGGKAPPAVAPATAPSRTAFQLGWAPPCKVVVTQRVEHDGRTVTIRYSTVITDDGERLRVKFEDGAITEVNGMNATTPEMQAKLAEMNRGFDTLPTFHVTVDGAFDHSDDLFRKIDDMVANSRISDEQAAIMKSPRMRDVVEEQIVAMWRSWVGAWRDWPTEPELDDAGLAHLETADTIDGQAFVEYMRVRGELSGIAVPADIRGSVTYRYAADIEPRTLRPHRVHYEHVVTIGDKTEQMAARDDTFDWDHAEGCGR